MACSLDTEGICCFGSSIIDLEIIILSLLEVTVVMSSFLSSFFLA